MNKQIVKAIVGNLIMGWLGTSLYWGGIGVVTFGMFSSVAVAMGTIFLLILFSIFFKFHNHIYSAMANSFSKGTYWIVVIIIFITTMSLTIASIFN
jgi:hypothetical protein